MTSIGDTSFFLIKNKTKKSIIFGSKEICFIIIDTIEYHRKLNKINFSTIVLVNKASMCQNNQVTKEKKNCENKLIMNLKKIY